MPTLEFFYDFVSPYSYLASTRVEAVARAAGATVRYRPFLLGAVFKATDNASPLETPAKAAGTLVDLGRWARRLGVPLRFPDTFPPKTLTLLRAALVADDEGRLAPFTRAGFEAVWVHGRDPADLAVVEAVAASAGLDGPRVAARAGAMKQALFAQTQEAVDRGAFGAPTFFVGEEMFVGNDRLDFVEEALRRGR